MTSPEDSAPSIRGRSDGKAGVAEASVTAYAQAALDALPLEYATKVYNVEFSIEATLTAEEGQRLGIRPGSLYGLYEGIPLTRRGSGYNHVSPDRITVYWGPLVRDYPNDGTLEDKVRKVVYHEIGHYFGLSEADLAHTSVR